MQNLIVEGGEIFSVKTNHGTRAYLDDNSILSHKPAEKFVGDENLLYADFDGSTLMFFVVRNGIVKYIRAIGNGGRTMLDENPCSQKFVRNVVSDSLSVNQNGQFWSAHAQNNRFWLAPRNSTWEKFYLEPTKEVSIGKTKVILLVFDAALLDNALERLNDERTNVEAILIAGKNDEELLALQTERKLPINSFDKLNRFALDGRDFLWLMVGADDSVKRRMSERLQSLDVPRGAIVDFDIKAKIDPTWLANVKAAAEGDCDFIATGDLRAALDLDVNQIVKRKGINLACDGQDLRQSYFAAKYALEHNKSIKFVLIGLTPEALDVADDHFSECGADCRYAFDDGGATFNDKIFYSCFDATVKFPEDATPDPNLTALKQSCDRTYIADEVAPDETPLPALRDAAFQQLEDYIRLCSEHDVKPIGVLLSATVDNRTLERIKIMRRVLGLIEKTTDFMFIDLSTLPFIEDFFADKNRLNIKGAAAHIRNSDELISALKSKVEAATADGKAALALSGGIDSAILAKFMPEGSTAYTFRCLVPGKQVTDESERARAIADACHLNHKIVDISWDDQISAADILMKHKHAPIHSIEAQIYKAALQIKTDGFTKFILGENADIIYGGMDGLLAKDWTVGEFIERYSYVMPHKVLRHPVMITAPFDEFEVDGHIDGHDFINKYFRQEALGTYTNACDAAGVQFIGPYSETNWIEPIDYQKIRAGQSKYVVREAFAQLFPNVEAPKKIPMPRPMNEWMSAWAGPTREEFIPHCTDGMSGDQKWMVYCLERFLNLTD